MSIPVDVVELARVREAFGAAFLITVSADGRPKVVTVEPTVADGVITVTAPGKGSLANAAARPDVTVVFPPPEAKGFTLLVDGRAVVEDDVVRVTPASAVLHRPAAHGDGPPAPVRGEATGCDNDCHPVV